MSWTQLGQTGMPDRLCWGHKMNDHPIHLTNEGPAAPYGTSVGDYTDRNYFTIPTSSINTGGINTVAASGSEATTHAPWGGAIRDRHRRIPGMPTTNSDYQQFVEDEDIRRAIADGLDGFTSLWTNFNVTTDDKAKRARKSIVGCTKVANFKTIPVPDMTLTAGTMTAAAFASALVDLFGITGTFGNGCFRMDDGKFVISPFVSGATNSSSWKTAQWWTDMFTALDTAGYPTVMVVMPTSNSTAMYDYFDAIVVNGIKRAVGYNFFGPTTPSRVASAATIGSVMRARSGNTNNIYMAPICFQDVRVAWGQYWESNGWKLLQDSADQVITNRSQAPSAKLDWVQLKTWSDYTEGCAFASSEMEVGNAKMGLLRRWFLPKWRNSTDPTLTTDSIHLAHRAHRMAEPIKLAAPLAAGTAYTSIQVPTSGVGSVTATLRPLLVIGAQLKFWTGATVTVAAQPNVGASSISIQSYTPTYLGTSGDGKLLTGSAYPASGLGAAGWIAGEVLQVPNVGATQQVRPQVNGKYLRQDLGNGDDTTDTVDVITLLTAPADVVVTVGGVAQTSYTAPAGYYRYPTPFPLAVGAAPSVAVSRSAVPQVSVTSKMAVVAQPWVITPGLYTAFAENPPTDPGSAPSSDPSFARHQWTYGTEAAWASANPTLRPGEPGATSTGRVKIGPGPGPVAWNDILFQDQLILARGMFNIRPKADRWQIASTVTGNAATGTPAAGVVYFIPLWSYPAWTVKSIGLFQNGATTLGTGGVLTNYVGVYKCDTDGYPDLASGPLTSASFNTTASGQKDNTVTPALLVTPISWLAFLSVQALGSGGVVPTFSCVNNALPIPTASSPGGTLYKYLATAAGQTALPTTALALTGGSSVVVPQMAALAA